MHQISEAAVPEEVLAKQEEQALLLEKQADQTQKLSKTTSFYKAQTDALGPSIAAVRAELNAYLHAEQSGIALTEQEIARKNELIATYKKQEAQQKTLLHGLNFPRLILWAVGWSAIYSAMRLAQQGVVEIITSVRDLNVAIDEMRIISHETAAEYTKDWEDIRVSIEEAARKGIVAQKALTNATVLLRFEGIKNKEAIVAANYVIKDLMTITRAKEPAEAAIALAQSYELFKDKLVGATTESEKMFKIGALLNKMFTDGHITFSEYNTMMSRVGLTAAHALPNFETLIALLQLMDAGFKGNRVGGLELAMVLMQLSENSSKLSDVFGITFDPNKLVSPLEIIDEIRKRIGDTIDASEQYWLKEAGFKDKSLEALRFILENQEAVNKLIEENITLDYSVVKAQSERIAQGHPLKRLWQEIIGLFTEAHQRELDFYAGAPESFIMREEFRKQIMGTSAEIEGAQKTLTEKTKDAASATKELNKEIGMTVSELEKIPIIVTKVIPKVPFAIEKNVTLLKQELKIRQQELDLRKLETIGVSETLLTRVRTQIIEEQIYGSILKVAHKTDDEVKQQERISALLKVRDADYKVIYATMKDLSIDEKDINEYILELLKQRQSLIEEQASIQLKMFEEIKSLADEIESTTVDFVKNLMTGTASVKDFMQSIIDAYRSAFAEQVGGMLADTGLFTGMAEVFLSPIQKAKLSLETGILDGSKAGSKLFYDSIIAASSDAAQPNGAAAPQAAGGISGLLQSIGGGGGGAGGGIGGFLKGISSMFGGIGGKKPTTGALQGPVTQAQAAQGYTNLSQVPQTPSKMAQAGQLAGKALGVAGALYGAYQGITAQKGVGKVQGALGGALSGAMAGAMIGSVVPVIGTLLGGIVGGVLGAVGGGIMGGKKAKTPEPEIKQQTLEIKSAIQISNKELQLINRNITGMRRDWEGYIMPRSSFFAERLGVEERFNRDRGRGIL